MSLDERAARRLSVIPSVFYRLIFSFMILVSLVSASVSLLSYIYFQSIYNKELVDFHQLYLENIEKELANRIVDSSKLIYMELDALLSQADSGLFEPEDVRADRASKIYTTYRALDDLVARNYDRVESISLFYVQAELLVSSSGYDAGGSSVLRGDGRDWLRELVSRDSRSAWVRFQRPEYLGIPTMTLLRALRSFPILASPQDCSIVVAIDFRESALRDIVSRLSPEDGGRTALVSRSLSDILATPDGKGWDEETMAALRAVAEKATGGFASEMREVEGGESLVSLSPISDSLWYLANVVRSSRLYERGAGIWRTILFIALVAIGLGAALAMVLTSGIYNPLERLLGRFRTQFRLPLPDKAFRTDEYRIIDDALTGLSTRMDELQATIEANRPVIGHELILRFLEGERIEVEELDETFGLLGAQPLPDRLRAVLASLPSEGRSSRQGEAVRGPVLKYRLAEELARVEGGFILASALSGERIGLIEAARDETDEDCRARLAALGAAIGGGHGTRVVFAAGPVVASPAELTASFAVARELAEYSFLYPELGAIVGLPDLLARSGRSAAPDKDFPELLAASLRARDTARFRSLLLRYAARAREGACSARACRAELERLGLVVADFARELRLSMQPPLERSLGELLAESADIDRFLEELVGVASEICAKAEDPQAQRNALLVARVKDHIARNLGGDLSLDRVGDAVAVSPGYLGKIFKEETGKNYIAYVTDARLEEAARLLVGSREPIQEISRRSGFNTPAYFIRLFKARYGLTPLDYRRNAADEVGKGTE